MTSYRLDIRRSAAEAIRRLPPEVKRAVKAAIRNLGANPLLGEPLQRALEGRFKFRVRRYRIIYIIDRSRRAVRILAVGHRRTIYEELADRSRQARP